ncbi:MAG TPA: NAD(P)/FAD-dependent oxidoreductase [Candidatus Angelobacter sp.]|jgi:phytoene dehydrogenase-like protein|nr:NAD(P)/FAD-dependent oxidoreductase [Candidatus Angelobacter sp.]
MSARDAVVVGSGPNGLAAAITLARAGRDVVVYERNSTPGGGVRSAELTLPGFTHDVCSTVQALLLVSPFFRRHGGFASHGLSFAHPATPLAHPFDDRDAVLLHRSVDDTATQFDDHDAAAYRRLMEPLVANAQALVDDLVGPLRLPHHPVADARFGLNALRSARGLAGGRFHDDAPRALVLGLGAHSMMPLHRPITASFALVLGMLGHAVGWPFARGGAQGIAGAMVAELRALGGEVICDHEVTSLDEMDARAVLLDLTPRQVLSVAGSRITGVYRRQLGRYRYGAGAFKVDWALDGPIPWRDPRCNQAGTVHVCGGAEEVIASEAAVGRGEHPQRPFVLLTQPSFADPARTPPGKHAVWGYCHVPNGSGVDMTARIEAQIERFAPGFRDRILARHVMGPAALEAYDPNYVGGDINGGVQDIRQLFTRPAVRLLPYTTPDRSLYLCSSSTPPGGGVHGISGMLAAEAALRRAY